MGFLDIPKPTRGSFARFLVFACLATFADAGAGRNMEQTSSERVLIVLMVFIFISLAFEIALHKLKHHLEHKHKLGLLTVLEKVKEELLLVGLISLILVAVEDYILDICVAKSDGGIPTINCPEHGFIDPYYSTVAKIDSSYGDAINSCNTTTKVGMTPALFQQIEAGTRSADDKDCYYRCNYNTLCTTWKRNQTTGVCELSNDKNTVSFNALSGMNTGLSCPAVAHTGHRHLLAAAAGAEKCPEGTASFIEAQALHQIHLLIFALALVHVAYSFCIFFLANQSVERWKKWESKHLDAAHKTKRGSTTLALLSTNLKEYQPRNHLFCNSKKATAVYHQFFSPLKMFSILVHRRYFITRNKKEMDFCFFKVVQADLQHDFGDLAGISAWMWLILALQLLLEGYGGQSQPGTFVWIGVVVNCCLGAVLVFISEDLEAQIWSHFDKDDDGEITIVELRQMMQDDMDTMDGVRTWFPFNKPRWLLQITRFIIWQNSQTLTLALFYYANDMWCYLDVRGTAVVWICIVLVIIFLVHQARVIVPLYSMLLHLSDNRSEGMMDRLAKRAKALHGTKSPRGHHGHGDKITIKTDGATPPPDTAKDEETTPLKASVKTAEPVPGTAQLPGVCNDDTVTADDVKGRAALPSLPKGGNKIYPVATEETETKDN